MLCLIVRSFFMTQLTGDMSTFPPTTELIVGPGTDTKVFPDGSLVEGDIAWVHRGLCVVSISKPFKTEEEK